MKICMVLPSASSVVRTVTPESGTTVVPPADRVPPVDKTMLKLAGVL